MIRFYKKSLQRSFFSIFLIVFFFTHNTVIAQCAGFPATRADADCSGGTAMSNNMNANSGTYGYCGSSSSSAAFTGVNLNGAILRVCGNVTLGFGSWNSGSLVVSCGATVTINSNVTLNSNSGIVNYGTLIINGNLSYQNNNNFVYNESATSKMTITGSLNFPSNNGTNGYLKNAGYMKIGNYNAFAGVQTCFMDGGKLECTNFVYMDQNANCNGVSGNRFSFGSPGGSCIFRYTTSANLYKAFTNDSRWNIYRAAGASQTIAAPCNGNATGWGSAAIVTSAPALTVPSGEQPCNTITCLTLPVGLLKFAADPLNENVLLSWSTISETDNSYFTVERSADALTWFALTQIKGSGQTTGIINYEYEDVKPIKGINYYRLSQTDFDGRKKYFDIVYVDHKLNTEFRSTLYPNPTNGGYVNINVDHAPGDLKVEVVDLLGQVVSSSHIPLSDSGIMVSVPASGQLFFVVISSGSQVLDTHKVYALKDL
jgi:hypothetical protein